MMLTLYVDDKLVGVKRNTNHAYNDITVIFKDTVTEYKEFLVGTPKKINGTVMLKSNCAIGAKQIREGDNLIQVAQDMIRDMYEDMCNKLNITEPMHKDVEAAIKNLG